MADACGVSYHTIRKNLRRHGLKFSASERAALSGMTQRGQRRTIRHRPMTPEWRKRIQEARGGARSNFWKGGVTPERANIGRWTTEHAERVHRRNGYRCGICGSKQALKTHHIDPVWNNPGRARDESNLTTLCESCHSDVHRLNLELPFLEDVLAGRQLHDFWKRHAEGLPRPLAKPRPRVRRLVRGWSRVARIEYAGEEMTYDLAVTGPFHNFVANGFVVHNSVNEYSARYSVVRDRYYRPTVANVRKQSATNRQGGDEQIDELTAKQFVEWLDEVEGQHAKYEQFLEKGVSRELARVGLPVSVYTEWYWKIDLHNLLHFLSLRMDPHAQQEIRDFAIAMFALIRPVVPVAAEAFLDYNFQAMHLTRLEVEALRTGRPLASDNKRENAEWEEKKRRLGMQSAE
jgi:thymidylate synthase (FAD)